MKLLRRLAVVIVALGSASVAQADLIDIDPSEPIPWSNYISVFGGDSGTGDMTYDAGSGGFLQIQSTEESSAWGLNSLPRVSMYSKEIVAAGIVSGNRDVLSGSFAMYGAIPELGLDEQTLLVSGSMVDIFYSHQEETLDVLFMNDFVHDAVRDLAGRYGLWRNYLHVGTWGFDFPEAFCCDATIDDNYHWTNDNMFFYRRNPLPEPSAFVLLGIGLFGMGLARRRKQQA